MRECDLIRAKLAEYAVGALRARAQARVEEHVRACEECRAELAALERTGALVESVGLEEAPAGTWEGVRERIATEPAARPRERARGRLRWAWGAVMGAVAVALVMVFVVGPMRVGEPRLVVATEADQEMQATMEGHLSAVWAAPLSDVAAVGLKMAALEENG